MTWQGAAGCDGRLGRGARGAPACPACLQASAFARCRAPTLRGPRCHPLPPPRADHVREAFPGWELEFVNRSRDGPDAPPQRPFRITFPPLAEEAAKGRDGGGKKGKRKAGEAADGGGDGGAAAAAEPARKLVVESYTPVDPGPYPQDAPPQNRVRFTPVQTQAIMSGVQPGLTMVVGPPGACDRRRAVPAFCWAWGSLA